MKNTVTLLTKTICICLILGIASCNEKTKENPDAAEQTPIVKTPSAIISLGEASAIYDNYTKHRIPLIESYETQERVPDEKFEASRFVDFDYQTMKQYLAYIDQEAKNAGVKKITKLRLYFANYPDQDKFPNGKTVIHKRQNSIFMVPTLEQDGINYGFYVGSDGNAALIKDWNGNLKGDMGLKLDTKQKAFAGYAPNFSLNSNLQGSKSLALNFGQGGPPPKTDF